MSSKELKKWLFPGLNCSGGFPFVPGGINLFLELSKRYQIP